MTDVNQGGSDTTVINQPAPDVTVTTQPNPLPTDVETSPVEIHPTGQDNDDGGEVIHATTVVDSGNDNSGEQVSEIVTNHNTGISYIGPQTTEDDGYNPYHPERPTAETENNFVQPTSQPVYTIEPTQGTQSKVNPTYVTQQTQSNPENRVVSNIPTGVGPTGVTHKDSPSNLANKVDASTLGKVENTKIQGTASYISHIGEELETADQRKATGATATREQPNTNTFQSTNTVPNDIVNQKKSEVTNTASLNKATGDAAKTFHNSVMADGNIEKMSTVPAMTSKDNQVLTGKASEMHPETTDKRVTENPKVTPGDATPSTGLQKSATEHGLSQITNGVLVTSAAEHPEETTLADTSESAKGGLHRVSYGTTTRDESSDISYTITPGSTKMKETITGVPASTNDKGTAVNTGASGVTTKKSKISRTPTPIPYTLSSSDNWLPSSIIVQPSSIKKSKSSINPSEFPTSLPVAIAAANVVDEPSDTTLITIGFSQELNYNFLVENPLSSAQIFNFLPQALYYPFYVDENMDDADFNEEYDVFESTYASSSVFAGTTILSPTSSLVKRLLTPINGSLFMTDAIDNASRIVNTQTAINRKLIETTSSGSIQPSSTSTTALDSDIPSVNLTEIRVKQISPYVDSNKDYVVAVAEVYFPSKYIEQLKDHLNNKNSMIYANPVPSLKSLMNLTDSSVAIEGLIHSTEQTDLSSSNSTESNIESEQQVNQIFKSSIKNGTQYGSLDVTGVKRKHLPRNINIRLCILVLCLVFGLLFWVITSFAVFSLVKRRWVRNNTSPVINNRASFLNVTKIGLYGDDIGSLWSGSSSNDSASLDEKRQSSSGKHARRNQRFTYLSGASGDKSLCYANFIQNANGDTILGTNTMMTPNLNFQFSGDNHQTLSSYDTSEYNAGTDSFDFDLVNSTNNPFSDNYRVRPKSKTIDLFADNLEDDFDFGGDVTSESVADVQLDDLDELDEELYNNLMIAIKDRPSNDPLTIEAKKLMDQINKIKQTAAESDE